MSVVWMCVGAASFLFVLIVTCMIIKIAVRQNVSVSVASKFDSLNDRWDIWESRKDFENANNKAFLERHAKQVESYLEGFNKLLAEKK